MAQISQGIKLGYAEVTAEGTRPEPKTYTYIPDVKSIPALGSTPNTQQTTTLDDTQHTYIKGLTDVGGALDFTCNYTPAVIAAIDTVIGLQDSGKIIEWCVEFPDPLKKRIYWDGEVSPVYNTDVSVDAVVEGTISIIPNTIMNHEDIEE